MSDGGFSAAENAVFAKVSRRFLWLLLLMFMVSFIDRGNVGFAALTMNKEIGISTTTFALSLTCFAIAYFLCEIPSNLILARVGARTWLARISVTWGLASCACMLIVGAKSLITLRVLVGIAEAGFAPGTVLYMTYWFPQFQRARAQTKYMLAQPLAGMFGATLSGLILGLNGVLGLAGWRWLFLLEGLPAVILGVVAFFFLTDRPKDAKWLSDGERATLIGALERDEAERRRTTPQAAFRSVTREILTRDFLLICFGYGCVIGNASVAGAWMPLLIRDFAHPGMPYWTIGLLTALPALSALIVMPIWTFHADRTRERFWHCVIPMFAGCFGLWVAASVHDLPVQMAGLILANVCAVSAWPVYFTLPSLVLPPKAHAAGIAFLNVVGIVGTAATPLIMGILRDAMGTYTASLVSMGAVYLIGAAAMFLVPRRVFAASAGAAPAVASAQ
jgi:MFS transporter, ACS family, 4-hydroxyphenylacetate permease